MAKRAPSVRRQTLQTNGTISRVYVQDWRIEPVGKVKRALRQEIAEWATEQADENGNMSDAEVTPDLDAVRHVNQFGTPDVSVMEIA